MTQPHHLPALRQLEIDVQRVFDEAHPGFFATLIALVSAALVLGSTIFLVEHDLDRWALPVGSLGVLGIAVGVAIKAMGGGCK